MTQAELHAFLRKHRLAAISTVRSGAPQAAVVGIAVTDTLDIIFDTLSTSRKYANLVTDPRIALVVGWDAEQTMQIEGIADVPTGDELAACKEVYFAVWPDGRERQKWPHITYIRVRPRWLRFSDFGAVPPCIEELTLPVT